MCASQRIYPCRLASKYKFPLIAGALIHGRCNIHSLTFLYPQPLRFHRTFPILHARAELTWNHYRTLMKITSDDDRYLFAKEADRQGWSSRELAAQIQAGSLPAKGFNQPKQGPVARLQAKRGRLSTYRLIEAPGGRGLRLDPRVRNPSKKVTKSAW